MAEIKEIILGSGKLYIAEFEDELPTNAELEIEGNLAGNIKGGASVEYKPSIIEVDSDENITVARFIGKEEITFKSGYLTWNLDNLKHLSQGTITDNAVTGIRTLKIGGKGARKMKNYVVHFVHTKSDGFKVRATLVGNPTDGFSLAFAPDKESVIDAVFKALAHDGEGTQLIYSMEYDAE